MKTIPVKHFTNPFREPDLSGSITVRNIADLLGGSDMVQPLHRHDFYFMLFLETGIGSHQIDFIDYFVEDHTVFLMRPGQVHQLTLRAGSKGYLIQFSNEFFQSQDKHTQLLIRRMSQVSCCKTDAGAFSKLYTILHQIHREFEEKHEDYLHVIKSNLTICFIELFRQRQNNERSAKRITYSQEKFEKFIDLIETHITAHKQVGKYADMLNLSLFQLNAICKASIEKTASEIITGYIILEAKRELLATSNQISQIAFNLGYEDVSYFIRFFKKHIGQTPDVFRNNFK